MILEWGRPVIAFFLASALAVRGRRKRSLSEYGAVAAFLVGFLSFASSMRFGLTLVAFYMSATRATRYRAALKREIEDGYTNSTGNRSAKQVLASSLPGVLVGLLYVILFRYDAPISAMFKLRSSLNLAYLLFFSACAGDTFSSEIGIAMPGPGKQPVLVLAPWRSVPRGTNGGVTIEGTLASAFGGFIIGSTYFLAGPEYSYSQLWLVAVGTVGGFVGSLLDSIFGMFLQVSWFDTRSKKIIKSRPPPKDDKFIELICGSDILSGEAINALSAVLTCGLTPLVLPWFRVHYPNL